MAHSAITLNYESMKFKAIQQKAFIRLIEIHQPYSQKVHKSLTTFSI